MSRVHALSMLVTLSLAACLEPNPTWDHPGPAGDEQAEDSAADVTEASTEASTEGSTEESGSMDACGDGIPAADQICFEAEGHVSQLPDGGRPHPVELGDIDVDGAVDWLYADAGTDQLLHFPGDGSLVVDAAGWLAIGGASTPDDLALGNFEGAELLEIVGSAYQTNQNLYIWEHNGDIVDPSVRTVGDGLRGIAVGDLDKDGNDDIAVASQDSGELIAIYAPDPFDPQSGVTDAIAFAPGVYDVAFADMDGDTWLDAVAVARESGMVALFINDGEGHLIQVSTHPITVAPERVVLADWLGDETPEVAVAHGGGVSILHVEPSALTTWESALEIVVPGGAQDLLIADLDQDDDQDLVVLPRIDDQVFVYVNAGTTLSEAAKLPLPAPGWGISAGDLDGDEAIDLCVSVPDTSQLVVFRNDP